jgi:hypothetical protein
MEIKNTGPILSDLLTAIDGFKAKEHVYVSRSTPGMQLTPSPYGSPLSVFGIKELPLPDILTVAGIRSLTLNSIYDQDVLFRLNAAMHGEMTQTYLLDLLRDNMVVKGLQSIFSNCRTIAFDDWAAIGGASGLWAELLTNVIKPLGKADLEFIFYLGDPTRKLSFEVDEVLDIISAFSEHGKVTFALDENEAIGLWMILNGVQADVEITEQSSTDLKRKYFSIFRTMKVTRLLIYSANDAILYSDEEQFVFFRKKVGQNIELASDARQNFIAGYSAGMLMQLGIGHCIALGLIVFACLGELKYAPGRKDIYDYIQNWIMDLQMPESIKLYQD